MTVEFVPYQLYAPGALPGELGIEDCTPDEGMRQEEAVIARVWREEYWDAHQEAPAPGAIPPSQATLMAFIAPVDEAAPMPPPAALADSERLMRKVVGFPPGLEAEFFFSEHAERLTASLIGKDMEAFCIGFTARGLEAKIKDGQRHPFGPIVRAWLALREQPVQPVRRKDKRLLAVHGQQPRERPERRRGVVMSGLLDGRPADGGGQLQLFPRPRKDVLLLDLLDASGRPVLPKGGHGVPMASRLFVNAILAVGEEDRKLTNTPIDVTVRELRDMNYPNGAPNWRTMQWPALRAALEEADSYAVRLPEGSPYGDGWYMLRLRNSLSGLENARGLPDLDGVVRLDISFPPGSHAGPPIELPELQQLSVKSAPRWRAYIAALSLAWRPGKTRVPAGRRGFRIWSRKVENYPLLTLEDRSQLAFGDDSAGHRTKDKINAAWRDLPGLVTLEDEEHPDGNKGFRIVPAEVVRESD